MVQIWQTDFTFQFHLSESICVTTLVFFFSLNCSTLTATEFFQVIFHVQVVAELDEY